MGFEFNWDLIIKDPFSVDWEEVAREGIRGYLHQKMEDSARDSANRGSGVPLPVLGDGTSYNGRIALVKLIHQFIKDHFHYVPDPVLKDWYTKPEIAYAASLEIKKRYGKNINQIPKETFQKEFKSKGLSFDCDDTAGFAKKLAERAKANDAVVKTLVMDHSRRLSFYWWDHVICIISIGKGWFCGIDTSGIRYFHIKNGELEQQILLQYSKVFNTKYIDVFDSPYTF